MSHIRFLPPTDQKCAESSTYWQFFYYRPPGKFRFTHLGEIVKMLCQELDIYIYIYLYDALDNRYEFSTLDWLLHNFSQFLFMKSLNFFFFLILKSWQVCDWLAKWIIMLRFMDLRWPRVFRRSNAVLFLANMEFDKGFLTRCTLGSEVLTPVCWIALN